MLKRKITPYIENFLKTEKDKILLINGARQIGKSYLIRYIGTKLFKNFIEINLKEDAEGNRIFADVHTTEDLYIRLGAFYPHPLGDRKDTLIFLDEIQSYPHLLTMLKFLNQEKKYNFIASGSELGIALAQTPSVPIGSITIKQMFPLDFEEFLWATGIGEEWIETMKMSFKQEESLTEDSHNLMLKRFQYYLLIGGMPDAINRYLQDRDIVAIRQIQTDIHNLYKIDASQYDEKHRLAIRKIYDLIPSNLENKKKRIIIKNIEQKKGSTYSDYAQEFEYLTNSGVALEVTAVSNPHFPLVESLHKRLLKLYLNDVGLLTDILYKYNVDAVLQNKKSINLGNVYESVVAQELAAHGFKLHYYDNKQKGEVDFLIDDYKTLSVIPIEVKSGKDYTLHKALTKFINNEEYNIEKGVVFSNERKVYTDNKIIYMPIYFIMFLNNEPTTMSLNMPPL